MKPVTFVVTAVVVLALLAGVLAPAINYTEDTEGWQYDDYVADDDAVSSTGAIELVTIDGQQYAHANAVGSATITYSDHSETVTVAKADLDMILVMGQSNGEYLTQYAEPENATPVPEIGTAYYYGTEDYPTIKTYDTADCAMRPMVETPGTALIGDIWPSLAASYSDNSGVKTYVVSAAWGGQSITTFEPETGAIWLYTEQVIIDSMAAVDTDLFNLRGPYGYIWIQGEADENMTEAEYIELFDEMNTAILAGGLGVDTIQDCFISKVRTERAPVIAAAQEEICETIEHVYMACELADGFTYDNGYRADYSHYTQAGDNLIGAALGEYIGSFYYPNYDPMKDYRGLALLSIPLVILSLVVVSIRTERD